MRGATLLVSRFSLKRALDAAEVSRRSGREGSVSAVRLSPGDDYGLYGRAINGFGTPLLARGTKGQIRALGVRID